jgi:hypothetical protein
MTALFVVAALFLGGCLVSLRIHPLTTCQVCKKTGSRYGGVFKYSYRRCRKCGGSGRKDRWGPRSSSAGPTTPAIIRRSKGVCLQSSA